MKPVVNNDLSKKYSKGTIIIHWVSLLLILILVPTGFIMADSQAGDTKILLLRVHVFIGAAVFILTLFRVWFFFTKPRPAKLETGSTFHNKMVVWIDNSFYVVLLLLSVSGLATVVLGSLGQVIRTGDYSLFPKELNVPPLAAHQILAKLLIALLIAHVAGVVLHYVKFKENTLKRILP